MQFGAEMEAALCAYSSSTPKRTVIIIIAPLIICLKNCMAWLVSRARRWRGPGPRGGGGGGSVCNRGMLRLPIKLQHFAIYINWFMQIVVVTGTHAITLESTARGTRCERTSFAGQRLARETKHW